MSKVRILSPRPEINKNTALVMRYFYLFWWNVRIQTTKFFCHVRIFPSVLRRMRQTCGAFLTILRCVWLLANLLIVTRSAQCAGCVYPRIYANCAGLVLIYSDSPRPEIQNRPFGRFFSVWDVRCALKMPVFFIA